ncbi:uncharacterized protein [Haliotis asinina]|uniref:uncharacterized protein n=1 Tax=Haliotis asinina TaxID=109174 RepID=UPI003531C1D9
MKTEKIDLDKNIDLLELVWQILNVYSFMSNVLSQSNAFGQEIVPFLNTGKSDESRQNFLIILSALSRWDEISLISPYARATIKIHKTPPKARLLVYSRDTVFYSTAQHLTEILAPLGKTADSFISDSSDFCTKLLKITEADQILSYDVVDLFTSVPIDETLQILRRRISELETPLDTNLTIDSITALSSACITSTYFTWGDDYYEQIHVLPMGSPLSPLLTEIYMTSFEKQALSTSTIKPTCWYRKVDDTFVILRQYQDPATLLQHLNQQHPRVQFTLEKKQMVSFPF